MLGQLLRINQVLDLHYRMWEHLAMMDYKTNSSQAKHHHHQAKKAWRWNPQVKWKRRRPRNSWRYTVERKVYEVDRLELVPVTERRTRQKGMERSPERLLPHTACCSRFYDTITETKIELTPCCFFHKNHELIWVLNNLKTLTFLFRSCI